MLCPIQLRNRQIVFPSLFKKKRYRAHLDVANSTKELLQHVDGGILLTNTGGLLIKAIGNGSCNEFIDDTHSIDVGNDVFPKYGISTNEHHAAPFWVQRMQRFSSWCRDVSPLSVRK